MGIALVDFRTFRISNYSLVIGLTLVWPALSLLREPFQLSLEVLLFAGVTLAAGLFSLIGMGDAKLLLLIGPWLHYDNMKFSLILLLALCWLQLTAELVLKRSFPQRIALAPAILAAAALNMAT
jgi:Flp pilus assembly protein protease CpaA